MTTDTPPSSDGEDTQPSFDSDAQAAIVDEHADGPTSGTPASPTPVTRRPRRLRAFLIGVVLAAALAILLFVVLGSTSSPKATGGGPVVGVGDPAPGFVLPSVVGGPPVDLHALGVDRHRPVVLNFFASWCTPCREETPLLASTARAEAAKGSVVQFVGVDGADPPQDAIAFIQQSGITYPVGQDSTFRVTQGLYGLSGEPNTFFIDASGIVVGHTIGPVTESQLNRWLHRLGGVKG